MFKRSKLLLPWNMLIEGQGDTREAAKADLQGKIALWRMKGVAKMGGVYMRYDLSDAKKAEHKEELLSTLLGAK